MNEFVLATPVALIMFNRPDATARVFEQIRQARPPKLLVAADGPRHDHPDDSVRCAAARAFIDQVDWPCEVLKKYSDINLGCGENPAKGISWVFDQVEEAIILEDDCIPHPTFFRFCQELLERFRDDERIMHIAGNNSMVVSKKGNSSYYFSLFPHCWGWASWRRAWRSFDFEMRLLPEIVEHGWLETLLQDKRASRYWTKRFKEVDPPGKMNIWDYQWTFACWANNGLSILPNVNLISNIGFDDHATHTRNDEGQVSSWAAEAMPFPLRHPRYMIRDTDADHLTQERIFSQGFVKMFVRAVKNKIRR